MGFWMEAIKECLNGCVEQLDGEADSNQNSEGEKPGNRGVPEGQDHHAQDGQQDVSTYCPLPSPAGSETPKAIHNSFKHWTIFGFRHCKQPFLR